ncbi:DUF6717 family protein [uncultured Duncaniella sp.]|uniref:DUF6717 family protein n=1 Tax=uncultured Duncaniella sp. TaxID=2768039 RepID=UPI00272B6C0E|nr:DUF6717 family protein [uncultured Duncaniella sp.]
MATANLYANQLESNAGHETVAFKLAKKPKSRRFTSSSRVSGDRANLEMVAGSDDLFTNLEAECRHKVTIHVVPSEKPMEVEGHVELRQLDKSLLGGSHYDATGFAGFRMRRIWVCPVTLCVLGRYSKYLYVEKV